MNCDQFRDSLNEMADQRVNFSRHDQLTQHADQCSACRKQLQWLQRITDCFENVETANHEATTLSGSRGLAFAVAATMVLVASLAWLGFRQTSNPSMASNQMASNQVASDQAGIGDVRPPPTGNRRVASRSARPPAGNEAPLPIVDVAWSDIGPRHWLGRTMPAVRGVQESVAPLGRSLLRAVMLLTSATAGETT